MSSETNNKIEKEHKKWSMMLSKVLRHTGASLGLDIDPEGFVPVDQLLTLKMFANLSKTDLQAIVDTNDKQRFTIKSDMGVMKIRANQGHSKKIGELLTDAVMLTRLDLHNAPTECIHGTYRECYDRNISNEGLKRMGRKHIHMAMSKNAISGMRKDTEVMIFIDITTAIIDGLKFYKSDNDVILCEDDILPKYFANVVFIGK